MSHGSFFARLNNIAITFLIHFLLSTDPALPLAFFYRQLPVFHVFMSAVISDVAIATYNYINGSMHFRS